MEQENNTAGLNDIDGVLPMDTYVIVNGIDDENGNEPSSTNAGGKKGRGRPKSAGSTKVNAIKPDTPKRARGRPAKTGESAPTPTPPPKKVAVVEAKNGEVSTNGDAIIKKRGRPSKTSIPNEQINGMSKLQIQPPAPVSNHQTQENGAEPEKKKRGRPSGTAVPPKKPAVSVSKEPPSKKKRGRPSGSAVGKKPAPKPKVPASNDGSAKKRGRPKKDAVVAATTSTPVNETAATATPTNVQ